MPKTVRPCPDKKHKWFKFNGDFATIKFTNGTDTEFKITAKVCLKCKEVVLEYASGNLPFEE